MLVLEWLGLFDSLVIKQNVNNSTMPKELTIVANIYSMSGKLTRKLALKKGTNSVSGLSRGVYIVKWAEDLSKIGFRH